MTDESRWLSFEEILAVHRRQILLFGGADGMRDQNAVASACERPRNLWSYAGQTDGARLAAALAFGLARNHGFVDGNKRTALASAAVFLRLNGLSLRAETEDVVRTFVGLAAGEVEEEDLAAWFRSRVRAVGADS